MYDEYSGHSDAIDGLPSTPDRSSSPRDVDSLNIASAIDLKRISQVDSQINISDRIERTSKEVVEHSFPSICSALIVSQSRVKIPELTIDLNSNEQKVVEQLGHIGDKINELFGSEFESMLGMFPPTESPFTILRKIFLGLFEGGRFSWGRIFAFINFGVKLFLRSINNPLAQSLKKLCIDIVKALGTMFAQGVFQWIADRGGWERIVPSNSIVDFFRNSTPLCQIGWGTAVGFLVALGYRLWRSSV